jgi:hypothetical protein
LPATRWRKWRSRPRHRRLQPRPQRHQRHLCNHHRQDPRVRALGKPARLHLQRFGHHLHGLRHPYQHRDGRPRLRLRLRLRLPSVLRITSSTKALEQSLVEANTSLPFSRFPAPARLTACSGRTRPTPPSGSPSTTTTIRVVLKDKGVQTSRQETPARSLFRIVGARTTSW